MFLFQYSQNCSVYFGLIHDSAAKLEKERDKTVPKTANLFTIPYPPIP
jgi:hypothetical protein